jgi:DNA-binding MarR family transcriptional regulator
MENTMGPELEKSIHELSMRMRLIKAAQEDKSPDELSERDIFLLQLLDGRNKMAVSEIASAYPEVSESTISTAVTRLWRDKGLVSKTISPTNQRVTIVQLTDMGKAALETAMKQRTQRMNALFHAIQVTDEEKEVLVRVFNRATNYFDEHLELRNDVANK